MKLEISGLTFSYENKKIFDGLEFSIREGEFVSLLGPSGCGKSTLLKLLTGVIAPEKGHILTDGQEIRGITEHFAYMPQKRPFISMENHFGKCVSLRQDPWRAGAGKKRSPVTDGGFWSGRL